MMTHTREQLALECQEAARRAETAVSKAEAYTQAGLAVPSELVLALAFLEDDLLAKILELQQAQPNGSALH